MSAIPHELNHESLCELWRQKVFEALVKKQRVETVAKQNLLQFKEQVRELSAERDAAVSER